MKKSDDDQFSSEKTEQRLQQILHSAFNMKPTPLKAIRKKPGKSKSVHSSAKRKPTHKS